MGNLSFLNVDSKLKHSKHTTAPKPTVRTKSNTPGNGVLCTPNSARYSIKATASLGIEAGMRDLESEGNHVLCLSRAPWDAVHVLSFGFFLIKKDGSSPPPGLL